MRRARRPDPGRSGAGRDAGLWFRRNSVGRAARGPVAVWYRSRTVNHRRSTRADGVGAVVALACGALAMLARALLYLYLVLVGIGLILERPAQLAIGY